MWQAAQRVLEACADHIEIPNKIEKVNDDESEETESKVDSEESDGVKEISNPPVYHFVGRSIAGGVCSLAAAIADGSIPPPPKAKRRKGSKSSSRSMSRSRGDSSKREIFRESKKVQEKQIHGFGAGRASAVSLGAPPSISANIKAGFVTSVICGDDVICRSTKNRPFCPGPLRQGNVQQESLPSGPSLRLKARPALRPAAESDPGIAVR